MSQEFIEEIFMRLPLPSEAECNCIVVPFLNHGNLIIGPYPEDRAAPQYGHIEFEKEFVSGIAIGWKLKETA